jgi:hypothetical protein
MTCSHVGYIVSYNDVQLQYLSIAKRLLTAFKQKCGVLTDASPFYVGKVCITV